MHDTLNVKIFRHSIQQKGHRYCGVSKTKSSSYCEVVKAKWCFKLQDNAHGGFWD